MTDSLHSKLLDIQQRLKVPKDKKNTFADFDYRKIEDIEDKVKPLLLEHNLTLMFDDEPVEVGGRVYIKATAYLSDGKGSISVTAYAREAVTPKAKTDDAQLTGACSSYARKYAASGMFLIDNTADADSQDNRKLSTPKADRRDAEKNAPISPQQKLKIKNLLEIQGVSKDDMPGYLEEQFGIIPGTVITAMDAQDIIDSLGGQNE